MNQHTSEQPHADQRDERIAADDAAAHNSGESVLERGNDRDARLPPSLVQLIGKVATHIAVAAFVVSVVLHMGGVLVSRFVAVGATGTGHPMAEEGPVEMAVVTEAELASLVDSAMAVDAPAVPDVVVDDPLPGGVADATPGDDQATGGDLGDIGPLAGGGDISVGSGSGLGGSGGGGGASFFGVEAQGNRFCYIVDVSGSMAGTRMDRLRHELTVSIKGLLETSQFIVFPFSTEAMTMEERKVWTDSSVNGKRWAEVQIARLTPDGGTNPGPAFKNAFTIRPRPDAIYFMTDGAFAGDADVTAQEIIRNAREYKVPVHCICFGDDSSEQRMKLIARQTRGSYTFVPDEGAP